jgi:hypothetical protein
MRGAGAPLVSPQIAASENIMRNSPLLVTLALLWAGCVGVMPRQNHSAAALAHALQALSPKVSAAEARRAAECAYTTSARLKHEYRIVGPAIFQNGLVNLGLREKGLCYHWTEDLLREMRRLDLKTLQIHWVVSHPGDFLESNALVLTPRGRPFTDGIVLDAWRHAGDLYWNATAVDRAFAWQEDHSEFARSKMTGPLRSPSI